MSATYLIFNLKKPEPILMEVTVEKKYGSCFGGSFFSCIACVVHCACMVHGTLGTRVELKGGFRGGDGPQDVKHCAT